MKPRVLFVCPAWDVSNTFVRDDFHLLEEFCDVLRVSYLPNDLLFPARLIKNLKGKDICYVWFGAEHAFWALLASRTLRKRMILVGGGYDAVCLPEIGYGIRCTNRLWRLGRFAFRHADLVLAFSEHSRQAIEAYSKAKRVRTCYLCFDSAKFKCTSPKRSLVVTTCHVNESNFKRKGLGTFIEVARALPHLSFAIIGQDTDGCGEKIKKNAPVNLNITGKLGERELVAMLSQARVYAQLSAHEGFGCALAEAMLCQCVPVVTNRGSLPEVAGPEAYYVPYDDSKSTVTAISKALEEKDGYQYRRRIEDYFPMHRRKEEIRSLVYSFL